MYYHRILHGCKMILVPNVYADHFDNIIDAKMGAAYSSNKSMIESLNRTHHMRTNKYTCRYDF